MLKGLQVKQPYPQHTRMHVWAVSSAKQVQGCSGNSTEVLSRAHCIDAHTRVCVAALQGAILQQPPGVEMAGGFSVPAADERPGDMGTSEYLSTLAPKLLRLQNLRQHPFAPRDAGAYMQWEPSQTEGLKKLQQLVTHWPCEPRQRLELEAVLNQLHWVGSCKALHRAAAQHTQCAAWQAACRHAA